MFPQSREEQLVQEAVDTVFQSNEEQPQREEPHFTTGKLFRAMHRGYWIIQPALGIIQKTQSREQCVEWLAFILLHGDSFDSIRKDGQTMSGSEYEQLLNDATARADDVASRYPYMDRRKLKRGTK